MDEDQGPEGTQHDSDADAIGPAEASAVDTLSHDDVAQAASGADHLMDAESSIILEPAPSNAVVVARLESRLRALEDALERSSSRVQELERRQSSENDLIRARLDDTLDVMSETLTRHRAVQAETQERIAHLLAASERTSRGYIDDLRNELTPRVMRSLQQVETIQARVQGEFETWNEDARVRIQQMEDAVRQIEQRDDRSSTMYDDALEELRNFTVRRIMETSQTLQEYREESLALGNENRERTAGLESDLREHVQTAERRLDVLDDRADTFDRELTEGLERIATSLQDRVDRLEDTTTSRVENQQRVLDEALQSTADSVTQRLTEFEDQQAARTGLLEEAIGAAQQDLEERTTSRVGQAEDRTARRVTEMLSRVDGMETLLNAALEQEKLARIEVEERITARADELIAATNEIRNQAGGVEVRLRGDLEAIAQRADGAANEIEGIRQQVAEAVSTIASRLSNEVAAMGGDMEALLDSVRSLEQRSAAVESHRRRIDELELQLDETTRMARSVNQALTTAVERRRAATASYADAEALVADDADAPDATEAPDED